MMIAFVTKRSRLCSAVGQCLGLPIHGHKARLGVQRFEIAPDGHADEESEKNDARLMKSRLKVAKHA